MRSPRRTVRITGGALSCACSGETGLPDTKNVTFTNFLDLAWRLDPRTGRCILLSAEDNLVKGASGQAIQSLNLMCGWPEETGLL